uniref:Uncharacterized protein n=1 Tax=Oryza brachyantha TaxID=4533 RepID=J3LVE4_ORYBR
MAAVEGGGGASASANGGPPDNPAAASASPPAGDPSSRLTPSVVFARVLLPGGQDQPRMAAVFSAPVLQFLPPNPPPPFP